MSSVFPKKHLNLKKPHFRPDTKPKIEVVSLMLCCYCRCDGQNSASRSPHGLHYHRCSYFQPTQYVFCSPRDFACKEVQIS
ncbi:hypothetical protein HanXRQr2_Chr12g0539881 [Helianthus annuus]|uniref:Uncharacterized protein n=1 Tax=Helianthus annuus TaxID=4232 RepID=A0A9K3HGA6_HELAN|nr:hypothetical protein HanXRQr2_Chr12g0539881 [Helianthus annuus]KAJ0862565.1 hypothetical protein HanPSC8_Chr12g0519661 [Helianthus annuus]